MHILGKYLVETHAHTSEISPCATCPAQLFGELFAQHGYSTVILTNHLCRAVYDKKGFTSWNSYIDSFVEGFRLAEKAAAGRFTVLMGAEINFTGAPNDYLAYGITEEFMLKHPDFTESSPKEFYPLAKENGILLIQAHPFRFGTRIINPDYLDGYEIYNGNPRHNSNNDIAAAWASKHGKPATAGTDFHEPGDIGLCGMEFDLPIASVDDFIHAILSGSGKAHEPQGLMHDARCIMHNE